MKTRLPKQSLVIKERLEEVTGEILAFAQDKIAMIILFGSYAKGTWVRDYYVEGHTSYSYESDLDIMVITKSPKFRGPRGARFKYDLHKHLEKAGLRGKTFGEPRVMIIVETITHVNEQLEKSRYLYFDIKKEGIMLYDSGNYKLAEPRELSSEERREIAKEDFELWFPEGEDFLKDSISVFKQRRYKRGAFYLHQATENFYNTILLVFTNYKGKTHDIEELGSLASNYSDELLKIFPRSTEEQEKCWTLLWEAYIRARYDKTYNITEEQLLYLISRVEKLKEVTEKICKTFINRPKVES